MKSYEMENEDYLERAWINLLFDPLLFLWQDSSVAVQPAGCCLSYSDFLVIFIIL